MIRARRATVADAGELLPRTRALNMQEGITVDDAALEMALGHLLANPELGGAWLVERDGVAIGHAVVTYGFDLEYAGRDAYLTELFIDPAERSRGAGSAALELLVAELPDVRALHLQVRAENPALRLYERHGFVASPRVVMTRLLDVVERR